MKWRPLFLLALLSSGLAACAGEIRGNSAAPPPQAAVVQNPEEALRTQATKLWEARIKNDLVTQYSLLEPKARETTTLTSFALARGTVVFLTYKITAVETAGDGGKVTAATTFRMNHPKMGRFGSFDQVVAMLWVRQDGVWYVKGSQDDAGKPLKAGEVPPQQ